MNVLRALGVYTRSVRSADGDAGEQKENYMPSIVPAMAVPMQMCVLPQIRRTRCDICAAGKTYEFCHNESPTGFHNLYTLKFHKKCTVSDKVNLSNESISRS